MTKYMIAVLAVSVSALVACGGGSGEGAKTPEGESAAPAGGATDPNAAPPAGGAADPNAAPPAGGAADPNAAPPAGGEAPKH